MKVTAETITDEQLAILRDQAGIRGDHDVVTDTFAAENPNSDMFWSDGRPNRNLARARCAAAWNARHGGG